MFKKQNYKKIINYVFASRSILYYSIKPIEAADALNRFLRMHYAI